MLALVRMGTGTDVTDDTYALPTHQLTCSIVQRRRMGVLQGFLETLRDAAPPSMVESYMNSPRQAKHGSMRRKSGKTSRCSTAQSTYRKRQDLLFSC